VRPFRPEARPGRARSRGRSLCDIQGSVQMERAEGEKGAGRLAAASIESIFMGNPLLRIWLCLCRWSREKRPRWVEGTTIRPWKLD
jgi:hypothetical protein